MTMVTGAQRVLVNVPGLTTVDLSAGLGFAKLGPRGSLRIGPTEGSTVALKVVHRAAAGMFGSAAVAELHATDTSSGLELTGKVRTLLIGDIAVWFLLLICGLTAAMAVGAASGGDIANALPATILTVVLLLMWWFSARRVAVDMVNTLVRELHSADGDFQNTLRSLVVDPSKERR